MSFIKHYWFGIITGLLFAIFVMMFILILLAPRQDALNRGFIPCSRQLADDLTNCNRNFFCSSRVILKNTRCDIRVIAAGVSEWIAGNQPYPWSNYIFTPEISANPFIDEEARQEYLKKHPDVKSEMERLHLLRKELENDQNRQEDQNLWPEE